MSKQASEEENKELNRVEEKLKELSKCGLFLDNIFIRDKTARQILVSAYNKLERQQKEIEKYKNVIRNLNNNWISKEEIREKIEDLESLSKNINMQPSIYNYEIDLLKELLEEN